MASDQEIRTTLARAREAIELRPSIAEGRTSLHLRLEQGLKCVAQSDEWSTEIDEPVSVGGEGNAPSPSVYGLSALAGCLAITTKMLAAQAGLQIDGIDLDIEADHDDRGFFRMDNVKPGFKGFRLTIDVQSPAAEEDIRAIVDEAMELSLWFNVFDGPQSVETDVRVNSNA
ncbi:MAG: OsmC family protein [Rhodovibrionaceae bacterium]|nr:OsmC family protein [Rhodovibrionaceae bacterium]